MNYTLDGLCAFLKSSVSAFHAVKNLGDLLEGAGYAPLRESGSWKLQPGGRYYVTRNQSSLIAFSVPERGFAPAMIVAAHSDSPVFRVKQRAELDGQGKYTLLNTERYGGMIMSTWLDRPLSVAGRVVARTQCGLESRLVNVDRDLVLIPNLAIHMNREVNEKGGLNARTDMPPLFGDAFARGGFEAAVAEAAGVAPEQIAGSDLYLYNRMAPSVWGPEGCYLSAPRLDDLECAYLAARAFTAAEGGYHINMVCVFDNEEVGSGTKQGADSTFLSDVIRRVAFSLGAGEEEICRALASSFMLSADNAHATHPNHPEYADPANQVFMNEGIVIKFNASQKYTTDGVSEAVFHRILERANVPCQHYANRSDLAGGSTLGNISGAHVSINTLDIGLAQLAMHSSYETAGVMDVEYMAQGIRTFYETEIACTADGDYTLSHRA